MQKTKLIDLFKALKIDELRDFAKFLDSPFYVKKAKKERIIRLFEYLKKNRSELNTKKLNRDYVFKKIFPKGEVFEDWKIRELRSELSKLIEEYFIVKEASQNHIDRQMLLIKSLEKRQVDKYFFKYVRNMEKELKELELKNMEHYLAQLRLQHQLYFHSATSFYDKDSGKRLSEILYNTDMFYSLAKLRYGDEIAAWKRTRGETIEGFISSEILEKLPDDVASNNLIICIYNLSNKLSKTRQYETYCEMKEIIMDNIDSFDKEQAYNVLTSLINSVRLVIFTEDVDIEALNLYKVGIERNLFIHGNRFVIGHFNNIVSLSCIAGEYTWTQEFINKYYTYLPTEDDRKENIGTLYMAQLNFVRKRYEEVERILNTLEFEDVSYGLRHYTLLIKSLYELGKVEMFDRCSAFKVYLFRKNRTHFISPEMHEGYNNFIKIVHKLTNLKVPASTKNIEIEKILDDINTMKVLIERLWLIEKTNEFRK